MKEIKVDLYEKRFHGNRKEDNIIKLLVPPNLIYKLNAISIKASAS